MLDIVSELVGYLSETIGCDAYAEAPRKRPEQFITIERTGGGEELHGLIDRPLVAVQSWGQSNYDASSLALIVDQAMLVAPNHITNLMSCERNSLYNFPDPDSRIARYQGIYELVTN